MVNQKQVDGFVKEALKHEQRQGEMLLALQRIIEGKSNRVQYTWPAATQGQPVNAATAEAAIAAIKATWQDEDED